MSNRGFLDVISLNEIDKIYKQLKSGQKVSLKDIEKYIDNPSISPTTVINLLQQEDKAKFIKFGEWEIIKPDISNFEENWKHEDYRVFVMLQMSLYYAGMQSAGKTAEILHVSIQDVWKLAKKFDELF